MSAQNIYSIDERLEKNDEPHETQQASQIYDAVKNSIKRYLHELEDTEPSEMYAMVLSQIEQPLLESVLEHTGGNQSRAAEYLGLNRGTLRKKLRIYDLD
ncbi:MAG: DNA-binding transcriptional regulator Fis [Gammaproteobacteria bacterium]|nr:DNA-binding transcriptional regulator Fis [Gammaproteobacteria bacterium]MCK5263012.1 DNA-binding transcriptional regulator Fis [Gammaproteobacteria bacterium]